MWSQKWGQVIIAKHLDPPNKPEINQVALRGAMPNPFNPATRIGFVLAREGFVTLSIYDVSGRLVDRVVNGVRSAGEHVVEWDARGVASGIYFYRLKAGKRTLTKKMVLLK